MVAETTMEKSKVKNTSKRNVFKNLKHSWSKIKFLSKSQVFKRFGIVVVIMTILALFMLTIDYGLGKGFNLLSNVSLNLPIIKTIISVIFLILAIALITLEVFRKSNTKGFHVPTKKIHTVNDTYTKAIRIISVVMFILLIFMYII